MVQENENVYDDGFPTEAPKTENKSYNKEDRPPLFRYLSAREKPYKFRLAQKPITFNKHFAAFKGVSDKKLQRPVSPAFDESEKGKDIAWSEGNWKPSVRYAAMIIDREDGFIKIVEFGGEIYKVFKTYFDAVGKSPVSKVDGPDWILTVKKVKKGAKDTVEYSCMADPTGPKPLSDAEFKSVNDMLETMVKISQKKYSNNTGWKMFFQPLTPDKIKELWLSLPEDKRKRQSFPKKGEEMYAQPPKSDSHPKAEEKQSEQQDIAFAQDEAIQASEPAQESKEEASDFF